MKREPILDCDVLVLGSGAGGLAAAVTAAARGLRVIVAEKEAVFGGTTAWSGGWMWIPRNPLATRAGIREDIDAPRTYLKHELGAHYDADKVDALLERGPEMVAFFERHTAVRFIDGNRIPDFHTTPGAGAGGRSVCAMPFDGRELGLLIDKLREPLSVTTIKGMALASGQDLAHFYRATRSPKSALYASRRLAAFAWHKLRYGRSMHLVNGNALVARLLKSAADRGVDLRTHAKAIGLMRDAERVTGARVEIDGVVHEVRAARGVVLACGGFPHDPARRAQTFAYTPSGREHWSAAPLCNTGDGIRLGEAVGAHFDQTLDAPAAWAPVSLVPQAGAAAVAFPHLIERAKPGVIAVTRAGRRFVNEASSYHDFISALLDTTPAGDEVCAWLICDHRFQRRYGLGFSKPRPFPVGPYLRSGYLKRGATLEALAHACGIDARALADTVAAYNPYAKQGADPAFHKGSTPYNRVQGDAAHRPNPCLAPIEAGPFYAVKLLPGSLGTFAGLATDRDARVLDRSGAAIAGLYAVGNDAASMMGGCYPSGGITLGPAMTFGYLAALSLADAAPDAARAGVDSSSRTMQ
ncbi:FAD-dependent oxidoreductase [Burkholderia multivorans]|uniref:FAD-dependent oxidoreductase n=1 Tax=Burkholderia multivorans TaxID=87883 RepID=UPI0012DD941D|nr:FAD-dependent oxidoreductase [Burkholderia multivorans]MBU9234956.1 FAD-dependent oxidoreductase [Burkholderia multivorans]MCA8313373.1 FAD-dependent oxidoreductase [Burkholderia multivorans]QGR90861.1 FAD-dependent oxidoreductase [Burkholderia multivorans]HEF4736115.1 FAD-dependent oxidoreductase [Burkholderia multivorans]